MKYLAVLGRLPKISVAELECLYENVKPTKDWKLATFEMGRGSEYPSMMMSRMGGSLKLAEEISDIKGYLEKLPVGKITLGVSDYRRGTRAFKAQGEALKLKKFLASKGRAVRVLENKEAVLSTATSHHNQIAEKPNHEEFILTDFGTFRVVGVQNITAYKHRDQERPFRDAKVGMLPPKLAQILINLCGNLCYGERVLDPFCGTGVVLQESALMGYIPFGTDLDARMVEYSRKNLEWLRKHNPLPEEDQGDLEEHLNESDVREGDATTTYWNGYFRIGGVATEAFLGQPMSTPPAEIKLRQEKERCQEIILKFLKNLGPQLDKRDFDARYTAPVVMAVPAWLRPDETYSRLNILDEVEKLGYNVKKFDNLGPEDLLYYREGQIVAREIIVLRRN